MLLLVLFHAFNHHAGLPILGDDEGVAVLRQVFGDLRSMALQVRDGLDVGMDGMVTLVETGLKFNAKFGFV